MSIKSHRLDSLFMWACIVALLSGLTLAGCGGSEKKSSAGDTNRAIERSGQEIESLPDNADGLKRSTEIFNRSKRKRGSVSKDEWDEFVAALEVKRSQQLTGAREELLQLVDKGQPPPQFLPSDRSHETYIVVTKRYKEKNEERRKHQAEMKRLEMESQLQPWRDLGNAMANQHQQARNEFMRRGICPDCHGDGKIIETLTNNCAVCSGSGVASGRKGLSNCTACGGVGKSDAGTREKECRACRGTGKYTGPPPAADATTPGAEKATFSYQGLKFVKPEGWHRQAKDVSAPFAFSTSDEKVRIQVSVRYAPFDPLKFVNSNLRTASQNEVRVLKDSGVESTSVGNKPAYYHRIIDSKSLIDYMHIDVAIPDGQRWWSVSFYGSQPRAMAQEAAFQKFLDSFEWQLYDDAQLAKWKTEQLDYRKNPVQPVQP